ncbi:MAG TPA: NUDIX hydrolase [Solirubrobacteraceae bacterium]|jgi:8-oxo-dGTP pyrophosphatase MutT (NUDIX family)
MEIEPQATDARPDEERDRPAVAHPRQSASVIVLRDGDPGGGLRVLLVRRSPQQRFMGGYWVFPGGAVDPHEGVGEAAHRRAAVRELREEASIDAIAPGELVAFSRWITPEQLPIRFETHFFLVRAPAGARARVDGSECVDLRWDTPRALLAAQQAGEIELAPPTSRQLEQLSGFASAAALLDHARAHDVRPLRPVVRSGEIARIALPGD